MVRLVRRSACALAFLSMCLLWPSIGSAQTSKVYFMFSADEADASSCRCVEAQAGSSAANAANALRVARLERAPELASLRRVGKTRCERNPTLTTWSAGALAQCPPDVEWVNGDWGTCSASCGWGSQSRDVSCQVTGAMPGDPGATLPDAFCPSATRPDDSEPCHLRACTVVDTTDPTPPDWVLATATDCEEMSVAWGEARDASGISHYQLFRGGQLLTQTLPSVRTYRDTTVAPSSRYSYVVRAWDAFGNYADRAAPEARTPACSTPEEPPGGGEIVSLVPGMASGRVRDVAVNPDAGLAAVVSDSGGLRVADLSTGAVRSLRLDGTAIAVHVWGETVLVLEVIGGGALQLRRVDASPQSLTPGVPLRLSGSFNGVAGAISRQNGVLFVAGSTAGLLLVDASNGLVERLVAWAGQPVLDVAVGDRVALAASPRGVLAVLEVDTSTPSIPQAVVRSVYGFSTNAVAVRGRFGMVSSGGLQELDLSNPGAPTIRAMSGFLSPSGQFEYWGNEVVEFTTFSEVRRTRPDPIGRDFDLIGTRQLGWQSANWTTAADRLYAIDAANGALHVIDRADLL